MAKKPNEPLTLQQSLGTIAISLVVFISAASDGSKWIGIISFFFFIVGIVGFVKAISRKVAEGSPARERTRSLTPSIQIARPALEAMRTEIVAGQRRLEAIEVFDPDATDLVDAWEGKKIARIEVLLREGDARTRSAWDRATAIINKAGDHIDKARGNLSRLVQQSEQQLALFKIDARDVRLDRSGVLTVEAKSVVSAKRIGPGEFNYRGIPVALNNTMGQAMRGNMSWQSAGAAALLTVAAVAVAYHINKSKTLRKLKDVEGELTLQSEAASGDIAMFQTLLATRILPQFEALMMLSATIEGHLAGLVNVPATAASRSDPPAVAYLLTITFREAKHYLEMTAGD